ncbi:hypothetical protein BU24DRAFT_410594 [Aaosphaeria arxii CBS 175.79]|uniref:Uncharacterized protein n=1 Tax=Aaosphaeria arxii CBS 175.79 TaxID=1450172 RepID=A0A6A5XRG7_9PLEO|nr:uncharacterized protein BU24DRAFT_410594 [Aaosphaeria arxii CBS 175.79]KAF2014894.1 hypothetical protein BU24DRAFT_410594 [Aaosphaeria arxii CBS 175.79]
MYYQDYLKRNQACTQASNKAGKQGTIGSGARDTVQDGMDRYACMSEKGKEKKEEKANSQKLKGRLIEDPCQLQEAEMENERSALAQLRQRTTINGMRELVSESLPSIHSTAWVYDDGGTGGHWEQQQIQLNRHSARETAHDPVHPTLVMTSL